MQSSNNPHRVSAREIFLEALSKSTPPERKAYLDGACQGDSALRAKVEALLRSHREDNFLEGPAIVMESLAPTQHAAPLAEGPGTRLVWTDCAFGARHLSQRSRWPKRPDCNDSRRCTLGGRLVTISRFQSWGGTIGEDCLSLWPEFSCV
jgi:hypothetical protein